MLYRYPHYYGLFTCVADRCIDSCCSGWQIVIDDEALEAYKNYEGEYRRTLHENIDWQEGAFCHGTDGMCAFLRDDLLCDMYAHMGKDCLCKTCREYPRHTEEFENVRDISLSLSCPEVARIVMNMTEKVTFVEREDDSLEEYDDFDDFLYFILCDMRDEIISILQDRELDIESRIRTMLMLSESAQRHLEEGSLVMWSQTGEDDLPGSEKAPGACYESGAKDKTGISDEPKAGNEPEAFDRYELLKRQFSFLREGLELLYDDWDEVLMESEAVLFSGSSTFEARLCEFTSWWQGSSLMPLDIVLEQVLVYFVYIYLPGAVYDGNIKGKLDSAAGHGVELFLLFMARWLINGGQLDVTELVELVYRYSREIEHSDFNLEAVENFEWYR